MKSLGKPVVPAVLVALLALALTPILVHASAAPAVSGRVVDSQEQPVQGAHVALFLGDSPEPHAEQETDRAGQYVLDLPGGPVDGVRLEVSRPHFKSAIWQADQSSGGGRRHQRLPDERAAGPAGRA